VFSVVIGVWGRRPKRRVDCFVVRDFLFILVVFLSSSMFKSSVPSVSDCDGLGGDETGSWDLFFLDPEQLHLLVNPADLYQHTTCT
jgi:hypothetical protein